MSRDQWMWMQASVALMAAAAAAMRYNAAETVPAVAQQVGIR